jgi:hypothetical protein
MNVESVVSKRKSDGPDAYGSARGVTSGRHSLRPDVVERLRQRKYSNGQREYDRASCTTEHIYGAGHAGNADSEVCGVQVHLIDSQLNGNAQFDSLYDPLAR